MLHWSEYIMYFFQKTKIITVSDSKKKEQIQELFAKHNIEYKIKVKEILQKIPLILRL